MRGKQMEEELLAFVVECREGFVEQPEASRVQRQSREAHPSALPCRQAPRGKREPPPKAYPVECRTALGAIAANTAKPEREVEIFIGVEVVLEPRQMTYEGEAFAKPGLQVCNRPTRPANLTGIDPCQTSETPQQRRLAAAVGPAKTDGFAR